MLTTKECREKVFYPPAIRVKVAATAQGSVSPSAKPAHTEAFAQLRVTRPQHLFQLLLQKRY